MPTAKQNRIGTWTIRALAPLALAAAAPAAHASLAISAAPTSNVTCSGGTCTATATDAVLNATDLKMFLRHGNVHVDAGPANTIAVNATVNWTQGSRLTLSANTGVAVTQPIVVAGHGAVTLTTGDTSAGAIVFTGRGRLDFWDTTSSLIINGSSYTLANDVASLASAIAANTHGNFALAKSYDAMADAPYTASPIYVLYGSLNGLGHAISNVKIQSTETYAAFIAYLLADSASSVSNLTLAQIDLTGTGHGAYVGGLAGYAEDTLSHVRVTGHVKGTDLATVGGIVGWQAPASMVAIVDSSVNAVVSGSPGSIAGGIVGFQYHGYILRCAVAGRIEGGASYAGGLAGLVQGNVISGNWSSARVSGNFAGGLVGLANGVFTLADNYVSGAVFSGGGLIGKTVGLGGGSGGPSVQRSYARGVVHGGGVTGNDDGSGVYTDVYWDMDTTHVRNPASGVLNHPNYPGITGLSDTQMKAALPAGFSPSVWGLNPSINNGYPYLLANPPQ